MGLVSCEKYSTIEEPEFQVTSNGSSFKVGQNVTFQFQGNPNNITFYSGEVGNKYEFSNRTSVAGKAELSFTSFRQNNKPNTLKFLASTDFTGLADSASITKATWMDLTNKVTLSTGVDNTPSGVVDLTDLQALKKPVYFAFRYTDVTSATAQATWTISNFLVKNTVNGIPYTIQNIADAGWGRYSAINKTNLWTITATSVRYAGGAANTPDNDAWVIARPADLSFVPRDLGTTIKDINLKLTSYDYTFTTPGTYKVVFVAGNLNIENSKTIVRELTINVVP